MARKKVTLAYISSDTDRKASFKKRKKGLIKKVSEISTLCDVESCAVIYGENETEPEVWPSLEGVQHVMERFQRLSETDRTRKMVNQEGFSQQCIEKSQIQLHRLLRENKRKELKLFMYQVLSGQAPLQEFDMSRAAEMSSLVQEIQRDIQARIEALHGNDDHVNNANPATNEVAPGYGNI